MKLLSTHLDAVKLIELRSFRDERGFFVERYKESIFKEMGINEKFSQDNHSRSKPNVLRGLHFQSTPPQGKLVGVVRGRIWDVAVDLRKGSPTFGQHFGAELSDDNGRVLWIPFGFAHGFCILGEEEADVVYKVTGEFNAASDTGVRWNDPFLNISWPLKNPLVSAKDQVLPLVSETKPL